MVKPPFGHFDRVEQQELAHIFKDLVFLEREVETAKIEVALKADFNLMDAFKMFDIGGRGFITQRDFAEGLRDSLQFHEFSEQDVYLFFRRNDMGGRGSLNFHNFSAGILPFSQEYAQLVTDRPDYYLARGCRDTKRFFSGETRLEFQAFWRTVFKAERAAEDLRERITKRVYFNMHDAFDFVNRSGSKTLAAIELRDFMAENGFYATDREMRGLIMRLDRDGDGLISFRDFMEELTPKLPMH